MGLTAATTAATPSKSIKFGAENYQGVIAEESLHSSHLSETSLTWHNEEQDEDCVMEVPNDLHVQKHVTADTPFGPVESNLSADQMYFL